MADSTWDMIIKSINDLPSLVYVTITQNNEPLMDPSIYNKIRDVNRKTGKKSIIITNGKALVDAKTRASLVDAAPSRVDISLISGNKEEYETITGLSFSRTINTILGNVNFTPLREIYYGKVLSEFRKEMSQGIYSLSMCKTCAKEFGYGI